MGIISFSSFKQANISFSTNLPDDVFEPGEVKPAPPTKKKAPNGMAGAPKKRPAPSEVCRD